MIKLIVVCHPFQMMNNINRCTTNIQDIRHTLKRKVTWDEPIEKAKIQNEIRFSYLGHLGVKLI
jgi:hypothetical protein